MTCASCVMRVERALKNVPGVQDVSVNLATESARIDRLVDEAIDEVAGTQPGAEDMQAPAPRRAARLRARAQPRAGRRRRSRRRFALGTASASVACRLAVVGAFAGAHADGDPFGQDWMLPPWLQLLLATPVQFWLGARFYRAGWHALKAGAGNMDLLVALGTSAAFGLSLWLWWRAATGEPTRGHARDAASAISKPNVVIIALVLRQMAGGARQAANHLGHSRAAVAAAAAWRSRTWSARAARKRRAAGRGVAL